MRGRRCETTRAELPASEIGPASREEPALPDVPAEAAAALEHLGPETGRKRERPKSESVSSKRAAREPTDQRGSARTTRSCRFDRAALDKGGRLRAVRGLRSRAARKVWLERETDDHQRNAGSWL